jgi:hypothetical protein
LSGEIENIVFTLIKIRWFLSALSADAGQLSAQSTSAPAMIGYTRKMFRDFVGITHRRRTNVFCLRTIVQNIKHAWSAKTLFRNKSFCFLYPQTMDLSNVCARHIFTHLQ